MRHNFCNSLAPRNLFQFLDDSTLVTLNVEDSQLLLNLFKKCCKWGNLIAGVDKCETFGIKKNGTLLRQLKPYIRINNELILRVKIGVNFIYFGKSFSFDMNIVDIKVQLVIDMNKYFHILNRLPLHPKHKLFIILIILMSVTLRVPGLYII